MIWKLMYTVLIVGFHRISAALTWDSNHNSTESLIISKPVYNNGFIDLIDNNIPVTDSDTDDNTNLSCISFYTLTMSSVYLTQLVWGIISSDDILNLNCCTQCECIPRSLFVTIVTISNFCKASGLLLFFNSLLLLNKQCLEDNRMALIVTFIDPVIIALYFAASRCYLQRNNAGECSFHFGRNILRKTAIAGGSILVSNLVFFFANPGWENYWNLIPTIGIPFTFGSLFAISKYRRDRENDNDNDLALLPQPN